MRNKRIYVFGFLLSLMWVWMLGRIFYIQVVKGDHYAGLVQRQSLSRKIIPPERGEIYDRESRKLVLNAEVELSLDQGKTRKLNRVSQYGSLAGQVLGNLGRDGYGQTGLEYVQDKALRGTDGWQYVRFDVKRKYYPAFEGNKKEPVNGVNIISTLDLEVQRIAERALEKGVKKVNALSGVAIVMDPYTGDILAMANYPFYNPNRRNKKDLKSWKNLAISKVFEPGSTFKIITAASALEEGVIKPDDLIYAEDGQFEKNGALIKDTKAQGKISFTKAMAYSSNIVMVKVAHRMKAKTFYQYIRSFGFGMKTGIDLPAEEGGILSTVRSWNIRSQATLSWGQELSVTPLQITMAAAAIANGGTLMKPRIVFEHRDENLELQKRFPVKKIRQVISPEVAETLRDMLTKVVEYGTAKRISSSNYTIAGKTGTVEKIDPKTGLYIPGKFHSSFVGMVPAKKPVYVCYVLIDEPKVDKYGGSSAAPVFKEIMDRILFLPENSLVPKLNLVQKNKKNSKGTKDEDYQINQASIGFSNLSGSSLVPNSDSIIEEELLEMPDLKNLSLRDALNQLKELPIHIEYTGIGKVTLQSPKAGSKMRPGDKCSLKLERQI